MMVLILARGKRVEKMETLECVYYSHISYLWRAVTSEGRGHGRHVLLVELEPLNSVQTPWGPGANI